MLKRSVLAFSIGVVWVFAHVARAQHSGPPANSPEEECTRECHIKHCDEWLGCSSAADLTRCRAEVNRHEAECMKHCAPEKM